MSVPARLGIVTLGVADLARSSAFYEALGWERWGASSAAVAAGGTLLRPATLTDWGGTSGYFADRDGHPWEVAHNPHFPIDPDGRLRIP